MCVRTGAFSIVLLVGLATAWPAGADPPGQIKHVPGPLAGAGLPAVTLAVGYALMRLYRARRKTVPEAKLHRSASPDPRGELD